MTSLVSLIGRPAVSRNSAQDLGQLHDVVVDIPDRKVLAWQLGKGRKGRVVEQAHIVGIGDAAVMVDDEANVREASSDAESATVHGDRSLIGARVLTDAGDELGEVSDADVDTDSGAITSVSVGERRIDAGALLGFGAYALVVRA